MGTGSSRRRTGRRPAPPGIIPLHGHLELVDAATLGVHRLDPRSRVREERAFGDMKTHIADFYKRVEPVHSFEDMAGAVFDCVPIEQQPSLRGHRGPIASPPDLRPVLQGGDPVEQAPMLGLPRGAASRDRHGNARQAPPGTVPIRRLSLNDLGRFETLQDYFRKHPGPKPTGPSAPDANTANNHRYAYTEQTVDNIGGHSALAVYSPSIDANQVFSLAQHWYTGGTGAGHQTVELGWQVYPQLYGHSSPVFFIFWTSDNYATTGAYNLTRPGFVQWSSTTAVGAALSPVSVQGGQQQEIDIAAYLYQGNWWIYFGGVAPENALGYYPGSLFSGGQMASNATEILYGGETVCASVSWPAMGSGAPASAGWQQAAYQRAIYYCPASGGASWASLTPVQPSPECYTLNLGWDPPPSSWGVYFFYGGAGGGNC